MIRSKLYKLSRSRLIDTDWSLPHQTVSPGCIFYSQSEQRSGSFTGLSPQLRSHAAQPVGSRCLETGSRSRDSVPGRSARVIRDRWLHTNQSGVASA